MSNSIASFCADFPDRDNRLEVQRSSFGYNPSTPKKKLFCVAFHETSRWIFTTSFSQHRLKNSQRWTEREDKTRTRISTRIGAMKLDQFCPGYLFPKMFLLTFLPHFLHQLFTGTFLPLSANQWVKKLEINENCFFPLEKGCETEIKQTVWLIE